MTELIMALMIWISAQTGFAVPPAPNIENNTKIELRDIMQDCDNIKTEDPKRFEEVCVDTDDDTINVVALYNYITKTIHLPNYFDRNNSSHKSILLHELVHHLQYFNDEHKTVGCLELLEAQAYDLQEMWLKEHNVILEEDLEIGPFLRSWLTTCQYF